VVFGVVLDMYLDGHKVEAKRQRWGTSNTAHGVAAAAAPPAITLPSVNAAAPSQFTDARARPVAATSTEQRTTFSRVAVTIRPSVIAIRASFGQRTRNGEELVRTGSGTVVDSSGYAVTCHHVVAGASAIAVRRFHEPDRWMPASVMAAENDLALLRIAVDTPFPAASLGDSDGVQVGDWVLAVGHPFGLGTTVTAGLVSRRNSSLTYPSGLRYTGLIQTDASINEGSSGGPLVSTAGEVIGINTAIYSPTGTFSGAGFAIPSNRVREFVSRFLPSGTAGASAVAASGAGEWGVVFTDLTPAVSANLAYPGAGGVVVTDVTPFSPAHAASINQNDVIVAIAGTPVPNSSAAMRLRASLPRGRPVPVQLWRAGQMHTLLLPPLAG
jgi:serine protease Do